MLFSRNAVLTYVTAIVRMGAVGATAPVDFGKEAQKLNFLIRYPLLSELLLYMHRFILEKNLGDNQQHFVRETYQNESK